MKIDIETLRKTKGIGKKTLERIMQQHNIDKNIKAFRSEYTSDSRYKIDKNINLWQGDCLELMNHIPDKSVDMILADLPYGTTACNWDEVIPFEPLWSHYKRIIKDNGAIVLFGSEPFSTKLRMSNLDWYKYDWVWRKSQGADPFMSKIRPLNNIELISVFCKNSCLYNPQLSKGEPYIHERERYGNIINNITGATMKNTKTINSGHRYPTRVLEYSRALGYHPTQKPVDLLEYLTKTYTNENMLVLDNTMGSGSTGVACKNLNRRFIGIELEEKYFNVAKKRISEV